MKYIINFFVYYFFISCSPIINAELINNENVGYRIIKVNYPTKPSSRWFDSPKLQNEKSFYLTHSYIRHEPLIVNNQLFFGLEGVENVNQVKDYHIKQIENSFSKLNGLKLMVSDTVVHVLRFKPDDFVSLGFLGGPKVHLVNKNSKITDKAIIYPVINQELQFVKQNKYREAYYENFINIEFFIYKGYEKKSSQFIKRHSLVIQISEQTFAKNPKKLNITQDQWDFMVADLLKEFVEQQGKALKE